MVGREMKIFVLHYGIVDSDGASEIGCDKFGSIIDAQLTQNGIIKDFVCQYSHLAEDKIEDRCGSFVRVAYKNSLVELQIHIEEFEV